VRVIHPFHPLSGRDFDFVERRENWGEDRVWLHDEDGQLFSPPAGWTDVAAPDRSWWSRPTAVRLRQMTCWPSLIWRTGPH